MSRPRGGGEPRHGRHGLPESRRRRRAWLSSWRAALRLARRDALHHRGASLLIAVMVGLPVLLVTATSSVLATTDVTVEESLPVRLGTAQARVSDNASGPLVQDIDGEGYVSSDIDELPPLAGHEAGQPWTAGELQRLTGGEVARVGQPRLYADVRGGLQATRTLALSTEALPTAGLARLTAGRWPDRDEEVAVTPLGVAAGLPADGRLELRSSGGEPRTVRVTGVVEATDPDYEPVHLVVGASWLPAGPGSFLVSRPEPVTWDDVRSWNAYGLLVVSRAVVSDPPPDAPVPTALEDGRAQAAAVALLVSFALVLETTLLAGPAFAVSAGRRRRALALVAGNGADQRQLTRYVLAQAVVLGVGSVALGALAGTLAGWAAVRVGARVAFGAGIGTPPLDANLALTAVVAAAAIGASLLAAALPARGAARLALASALGGTSRPGPPSRPLLAAGLGLVAAGLGLAGLSLGVLTSDDQLYAAGFSGALMAVGALCCIPALLSLFGAPRRGPVAVRMAARDALRARSRSTPAIAAVTVAVAVLTIVGTSASSDDQQARRDYQPAAAAGRGIVFAGWDSEFRPVKPTAVLAEIARQHPGWGVAALGAAGQQASDRSRGTSDVVAAVPPGCSAAEAIAPQGPQAPGPCQVVGSNANPLLGYPAQALNPDGGLSTGQRAVLDAGGILVTAPELVVDGQVTLAVGTLQHPSNARSVVREVRLPGGTVEPATLEAATWRGQGDGAGGVALRQTLEAAGVPVEDTSWLVTDPTGPISPADEDAVNAQVPDAWTVERGFESPIRMIVRVLVGLTAALVAVAALVSTALTQAEGRPDHATLAAVGAPPGSRRRLAGAQALLIALTGTTLGVLVGLLPGVGLAVALTSDASNFDGTLSAPPVVAVPWLWLALVVLSVPLAAAALAAAAVRPTPVMTRRLT